MTRDAGTILQSCEYKDLAKNCKVFNLSTLNYHLWIYLNPEMVRDTYFNKAFEIGPDADNSKIFPDTFIREGIWIRVNMQYLNLKPGKHTIQLDFVDRYTDDDFSLYVSYIIQDDNPEKPYVYMKEDGAAEPLCNSTKHPTSFTLYEG